MDSQRAGLLVANWKMHQHWDDCEGFLTTLRGLLPQYFNEENEPLVDLAVCPAFPYLSYMGSLIHETVLYLGAQDVSHHKEGPHTGEVSAEMLGDVACDYCIVGHSERRAYPTETSEVIGMKLRHLRAAEVIPIFCVGEKEADRDGALAAQVVLDQLNEVAGELQQFTPEMLAIAYEPVWAIGTGRNAEPADAQEMAALIRQWLSGTLGGDFGVQVPILYGGSVNPGNIEPYLEQVDIDGALIGGASMQAESFAAMAQTALAVAERLQ